MKYNSIPKAQLRHSQEARESSMRDIERLVKIINNIPGDKLSYLDASSITKYLNELKRELDAEYEYHRAIRERK